MWMTNLPPRAHLETLNTTGAELRFGLGVFLRPPATLEWSIWPKRNIQISVKSGSNIFMPFSRLQNKNISFLPNKAILRPVGDCAQPPWRSENLPESTEAQLWSSSKAGGRECALNSAGLSTCGILYSQGF